MHYKIIIIKPGLKDWALFLINCKYKKTLYFHIDFYYNSR